MMVRMFKHKLINFILNIIEFFLQRIKKEVGCPLSIFVVGAPRSGTTLAYQFIASNFKLMYLSNFSENHVKYPLATSWLYKHKIKSFVSTYTSKYGKSVGRSSPSQGDNFWKKYSMENDVPRLISIMSDIAKAPFINKSIAMSLEIERINSNFDNAIFIRVKRNLIDNGYSQLQNLRNNGSEFYESGERWVSARPLNISELINLKEHEKVIGQLISINKQIDQSLDKIDDARIVEVDYDEFCSNPYELIDKITVALSNDDYIIERKKYNNVKFKSSNYEDCEDIIKLKEAILKYDQLDLIKKRATYE